MPDQRINVVLRSEESNGVVSMMDNTVKPRAGGPPLHRHDFDEAFYILEGELVFQVEDELITKRAGEMAFAPRGVTHTYANQTDEPARFVLVCTPAGLERYFGRLAAELAGEEPPAWAMQEIPKVERVGPQIGQS
jgi:quercetin dioxygenase-like cupin family protein